MHIIRGKSRRPDFVYRQALFFVKWLLLLINLYGYRWRLLARQCTWMVPKAAALYRLRLTSNMVRLNIWEKPSSPSGCQKHHWTSMWKIHAFRRLRGGKSLLSFLNTFSIKKALRTRQWGSLATASKIMRKLFICTSLCLQRTHCSASADADASSKNQANYKTTTFFCTMRKFSRSCERKIENHIFLKAILYFLRPFVV